METSAQPQRKLSLSALLTLAHQMLLRDVTKGRFREAALRRWTLNERQVWAGSVGVRFDSSAALPDLSQLSGPLHGHVGAAAMQRLG